MSIFEHESITHHNEMHDPDAWHVVDVAPAVHSEDNPQFEIRHDFCPGVVWVEDCDPFGRGSTYTHIRHECNVGLDVEFFGSDWAGKDNLNMEPGLYLVRGWFTRDYWGETEVYFEVKRLEGPVDMQYFEMLWPVSPEGKQS